MTLLDKQVTFLLNVSKLIQWASKNGFQLTAGELYRTEEQQQIYLKTGLSKVLRSQHQIRLAIDLNLFIDGDFITDKEKYKPLSDYWKALHPLNKAGYDWGWDANHFEMQ
jgi:hypothetical protein